VCLVTIGVIVATTSRPSVPVTAKVSDSGAYTIGIAMLSLSLVLTGILGILQERTYRKYGPHWQEGVFYTVCLRVQRDLDVHMYFLLARPLSSNVSFHAA